MPQRACPSRHSAGHVQLTPGRRWLAGLLLHNLDIHHGCHISFDSSEVPGQQPEEAANLAGDAQVQPCPGTVCANDLSCIGCKIQLSSAARPHFSKRQGSSCLGFYMVQAMAYVS